MKDNRLCCLPEEILHQSLQREEKAQQTGEGSLKKTRIWEENQSKSKPSKEQSTNLLHIYYFWSIGRLGITKELLEKCKMGGINTNERNVSKSNNCSWKKIRKKIARPLQNIYKNMLSSSNHSLHNNGRLVFVFNKRIKDYQGITQRLISREATWL